MLKAGNFWQAIAKPIVALAPMEDVTDSPFRETILRVTDPGRLHVLFTEFTSTDGLFHPIGRSKVSHRLLASDNEKSLLKSKQVKLVVQIWGANPEKFSFAAKYITENYDFDGIDINMGCPVKKIVKQGACSALIGNPTLAKEIIISVRESTHLPVSVKTRTGLRSHQTEKWLSDVFSAGPNALILHARTQKDESKVPADWEQFRVAKALRDEMAPNIALLGNGDVFTEDDISKVHLEYGLDGAMVGRGIFHNPWMFMGTGESPEPGQMLALLWDHAQSFQRMWGQNKNFNILKRFFKIYVHGYPGAHDLRVALMESTCMEEVEALLIETGYEFRKLRV